MLSVPPNLGSGSMTSLTDVWFQGLCARGKRGQEEMIKDRRVEGQGEERGRDRQGGFHWLGEGKGKGEEGQTVGGDRRREQGTDESILWRR